MLKRHLAAKTLERLLISELLSVQEEVKPAKFYDRVKNRLAKKGGKHEK